MKKPRITKSQEKSIKQLTQKVVDAYEVFRALSLKLDRKVEPINIKANKENDKDTVNKLIDLTTPIGKSGAGLSYGEYIGRFYLFGSICEIEEALKKKNKKKITKK